MKDNIIDLLTYRNALQQNPSSISQELADAIALLIKKMRETSGYSD